METITLSSKGQLVIPKAIRHSAHLAPGDVLSVRYVDGEIRLKPVTGVMPTSLAEVAGCLAKPGRKPLENLLDQAPDRPQRMIRRYPILQPNVGEEPQGPIISTAHQNLHRRHRQ